MSNYFEIQGYCSNSELSKFGQEINLLPKFKDNKERQFENFRIGTLSDILETEKHRIDRLNGCIIGTEYTFSDVELRTWERKQRLLYSQNFYKSILNAKPNFQKEVYLDNFTLDGIFYLPFKGKLDLFLPNLVIDLKTTVAESEGGFEWTCNEFGYFRQMIFYMALTGSTKSLLIGVCKTKDRIYKVHFDRTHPKFKENLNMCKLLIQKYCMIN